MVPWPTDSQTVPMASSLTAGLGRYVYRATSQHGQVIDLLEPAAFHNTGQYENNRCECDHERLKARLRLAAAFDELALAI